ncbi:thiamine biosynthesis lipoprotein ApbE [Pseudomonas savastanoi]|uniref:FAD:protein FMN transferase n=2 Tax=Pseudomonas syringae group genomosp. 2 TaxID=251698 RepID=A0A3M6AWA3_PSESS|nr:Thiamin biosynthesis lipoprotein ApbE [Pseudomonas syringae pv. cunninghamiae]KPX93440.1 Thiamin biosynthesis lipoprotein ApbE [Pseudomonas meliae]RMV17222.1 thiamine biosynthesis lipoprotein ApbE [Pseudomonas savastanoi]RMV19462.1 thiamine biosynthesis lipoprotein ApbE [Pseudomonas savastanoi]RMV22944.1 Thiamine biosynthesis lipoprotein [Pseudomonas savastanoi]
MRGISLRGFCRVAVYLVLLGCGGCGQERKLESFGGPAMGSHYSVVYVRASGQPEPAVVRPQIESILAEVDQQMSLWRSDSDIELFNALPANSCQTMPEPVLKLIGVGEQLSRDSDGAFDLTVKPLMDLWGLGAHALFEQMPLVRQLARTRATVGYRGLRVVGQQLCKSAAVQVDLNSIAAGYAVDRISERMEKLGLHDYLVQATGELKVSGLKPDGSPWRVTLDAPLDDGNVTQKVFPLKGYAVSTSGDYRRYADHDGWRISDTLDALTGKPISHSLASVTVIHPSALMADGLSSLLLILGPRRGWNYAQEHKIPAFFVIRADKRFIIRSNASFDRLAVEQPR